MTYLAEEECVSEAGMGDLVAQSPPQDFGFHFVMVSATFPPRLA